MTLHIFNFTLIVDSFRETTFDTLAVKMLLFNIQLLFIVRQIWFCYLLCFGWKHHFILCSFVDSFLSIQCLITFHQTIRICNLSKQLISNVIVPIEHWDDFLWVSNMLNCLRLLVNALILVYYLTTHIIPLQSNEMLVACHDDSIFCGSKETHINLTRENKLKRHFNQFNWIKNKNTQRFV